MCSTPRLVKEIQLDQLGKPEIIIERKCRIRTEEHNALSDLSILRVFILAEIWNVDQNQLIFQYYPRSKAKYKGQEIGRNVKTLNHRTRARIEFYQQLHLLLKMPNKKTTTFSFINGVYQEEVEKE